MEKGLLISIILFVRFVAVLGQSGTVRGEPISPLINPAETAIPNISEIAPVQNSYHVFQVIKEKMTNFS